MGVLLDLLADRRHDCGMGITYTQAPCLRGAVDIRIAFGIIQDRALATCYCERDSRPYTADAQGAATCSGFFVTFLNMIILPGDLDFMQTLIHALSAECSST
jgi:hypothetical protein